MTTTRVVARKSRFLVILALLILLSISFLAFYSTNSHQDEIILKCEQQIDAITEHKLRLEKSLQSERLIYEQTKRELNTQLKEQRDIHDKSSQDLNLRFGSLQQQYKILESQNNDLTEECSKTKKDQLENIDGLDHKVKSLKGQILKITKDKDSSIELWKIKYDTVQKEKANLEQILKTKTGGNNDDLLKSLKYKNFELEKDNHELRVKLHINDEQSHHQVPAPQKSIEVVKNFHEQLQVSADLYKLPLNPRPNTNNLNHLNAHILGNKGKVSGVGADGIINSVENFQMVNPKPIADDNNVLQQPIALKSSSTSTTPANVDHGGKKNLLPLAAIPTMTPDTPEKGGKKNKSTTSNDRKAKLKRPVKIPIGFVPVPAENVELNDNENDRYQNVREANDAANAANTANEVGSYKSLNKPPNPNEINFPPVNELENGAHELNDNNEFNIDDKGSRKDHDHLHEIQDEKINNNINNAAEEDTYDNLNHKKSAKNDDMDLEIINRPQDHKGNDKLLNEIAGDHGGYPEEDGDLHMEGPEAEEEGDVGEYDDPKALKQGVAERN